MPKDERWSPSRSNSKVGALFTGGVTDQWKNQSFLLRETLQSKAKLWRPTFQVGGSSDEPPEVHTAQRSRFVHDGSQVAAFKLLSIHQISKNSEFNL